MRLGKVIFNLEYVVDLDNNKMVEDAKEILIEDVESAIRHNEATNLVEVVDSPDSKESDIPSFLLELDEA